MILHPAHLAITEYGVVVSHPYATAHIGSAHLSESSREVLAAAIATAIERFERSGGPGGVVHGG